MPFARTDPFRPPIGQWNGHLQTIVPALSRRFPSVSYRRERLELPDGDFLDLDWLDAEDSRKLVVLTHGLEGSSDSQYIMGMADFFRKNAWSALAWNCRSCSGELNRLFRFYHHGDIEDLSSVVEHAISTHKFDRIAIIGFSMGGSMALKYAGSKGTKVPAELVAAIGFSVPCDIAAGADVLDRWDNFFYKKRFMSRLAQKILIKNERFPGRLDVSKLKTIQRWRDFDEHFSAPICGFRSAAEFHEQASSKNFLAGIACSALLVSAANDPILTDACFPEKLARGHRRFHFELTERGGHCGFAEAGQKTTWAERRALKFIEMQG